MHFRPAVRRSLHRFPAAAQSVLARNWHLIKQHMSTDFCAYLPLGIALRPSALLTLQTIAYSSLGVSHVGLMSFMHSRC